MASSLLSVFDDVAVLMDDVASAAKIATRKTAGILGDDLAVNAEKATGFLAEREIPILWAITRGSFINKVIIIPVALLLSAISPVVITFVLIAGGCYLAYEGAHSIIELIHVLRKRNPAAEVTEKQDTATEKAKIRSAITTDFILSVEIVIIALGTVLDKSLSIRILTVTVVSLIATVGVYGLVAFIVRMDDVGYKLLKRSDEKGFLAATGRLMVWLMPLIIKFLRFAGTLALFLVSGGIFVHNIEYLHHLFPEMPSMIKEFITGMVAGFIGTAIVESAKRVFRLMRKPA